MSKKLVSHTKKDDLGEKLEALAIAMAEDLSSSNTPMDERIGGFKALTAYYAMVHKLPPPQDESKGAFGGHKDAISGLGRGSARSAASSTPDF